MSSQACLRQTDSRQQHCRQQHFRQQALKDGNQPKNSNTCCSKNRQQTRRSPLLWCKYRQQISKTARPSRRHPGTGPLGLTERNRRRVNQQRPFYFNRRHAVALKQKRRVNRRLWRYFKRTRLRERARQVAKEVLHGSHLSKRKALTRKVKHKINKKCKRWGLNFFVLTSHIVTMKRDPAPSLVKIIPGVSLNQTR